MREDGTVNTAGTGVLFTLCFGAVVAAALQAVAPLVEGRLSWRQVPASGWVAWLCVAVPSLAQILFPGVYRALHRDAEAVTSGHQWWRLLTSVVVQDGGVIGTVSNLVLLALALCCACACGAQGPPSERLHLRRGPEHPGGAVRRNGWGR